MVDLEFEDFILELNDKAGEAAFILTVSGFILHCNARAAELFYYDYPCQLTGMHVTDLVPDDFAKHFPAEITEEHLTHGKYLQRVNKGKNGEHFPTYVKTEYVEIYGNRYVLTRVKERLKDDGFQEAVAGADELLQTIDLLKCELKKEKGRVNALKGAEAIVLNKKLCTRLSLQHSDLTQNDYRLATLLFESTDTKMIAERLNITQNAVNIGRKRLRKKLSLPREKTIIHYLLEVMR